MGDWELVSESYCICSTFIDAMHILNDTNFTVYQQKCIFLCGEKRVINVWNQESPIEINIV